MAPKPSFRDLLHSSLGEKYLNQIFAPYENQRKPLFKPWYNQTGEYGEMYPSQGLLKTPYDFLDNIGATIMGEDELWATLKMRRYILEIFNHPERIQFLLSTQKHQFTPPPAVSNQVVDFSLKSGLALSVRDLSAVVLGTDGKRIGRRDLLLKGPFIKLGKYTRIPFSSAAMPDVFGSPAAIATVAICHALTCIPRNGLFSNITRQVDLAKSAIDWMKQEQLLQGRKDANLLLKLWKQNLVGVVEPETPHALKRTAALYRAGIKSFRVYSPEPGKDAIDTITRLRRAYGQTIEIFAGQAASTKQAVLLEQAGADGLYIGIGGGGRCITAIRSGSAVDWPGLLWEMRGKVKIPIIVEGGASDHIGTTLLLGASGIGVSRMAAGGTIESPGGLLYWVNHKGLWFKPYGGEASARTKYLDNKVLALGLPAFVEGETTKAIKSYIPYAKPTVAENIYFLLEDLILSLVFRGVNSISNLQSINPSPLRRITHFGTEQQNPH